MLHLPDVLQCQPARWVQEVHDCPMQSDPNWHWVVIFSCFCVACRWPISPCSDACPSCNVLFFHQTDVISEDNQLEARACKKWPIGKQHTLCHKHSDKVGCFFSPSIPHLKHHFSPYLHHNQPQPSLSHSLYHLVLWDRAPHWCKSPSFTSTLSSDQTQPQDVFTPLPASVIIHSDSHQAWVLCKTTQPKQLPTCKKRCQPWSGCSPP